MLATVSKILMRHTPTIRAPHHASLADEAVAAEGDDDGMPGPCAPEVAANDCAGGDDGFPAEDDVLRTCDSGAT